MRCAWDCHPHSKTCGNCAGRQQQRSQRRATQIHLGSFGDSVWHRRHHPDFAVMHLLVCGTCRDDLVLAGTVRDPLTCPRLMQLPLRSLTKCRMCPVLLRSLSYFWDRVKHLRLPFLHVPHCPCITLRLLRDAVQFSSVCAKQIGQTPNTFALHGRSRSYFLRNNPPSSLNLRMSDISNFLVATTT